MDLKRQKLGASGPGTSKFEERKTATQRENEGRIDDNCAKMTRNFRKLIESAKIRTETRAHDTQEALETSVCAANLVSTGEMLMGMISELKLAATLQQVETMNAEVDVRNAALDSETAQLDRNAALLGSDISAALSELEDHYYSSVARTGGSR